ncbi:TPA: phage head morphogenesis protein, partial [Clostridioides difficile]|nr:phage head morphogenesis protein [Clostridioides difficile]HBG4043769.1 phage head morphogenesis protein [Clostridioides difficile]HBG7465069.1 phage head morphogenesis protein [Clostridioides difficile]HDF2484582.1 phage head morphogenesis protein [Clostridioides difficile]HDO8852340.1 phage head morphogenesis protein [Clostridioides difficile]
EAQNNKSVKYYLELEKQYKLAMNSIEKDILAWYNRFAKNEGISLLEAKKLLNTRELEEFKWSVEEYIRHGKENAINQKWMKELENASARVHITRLEALKLQIQQQVEVLYGNELDGIDKLMRDIYTSGYYHT